MIDITNLSFADRTALVDYANAIRDVSLIALIHKPTSPVGPAKKAKIWKRAEQEIRKPIHESFVALQLLKQSADPELPELAEQCLQQNCSAGKQLRKLGRNIKNELAVQ